MMPQFGTLVIKLRYKGQIKNWRVAGLQCDNNEQVARKHAAKWAPDAEFLGWRFLPDKTR